MNRILTMVLAGLTILVLTMPVRAQGYLLDLDDPSTYSIDCGKLTPGKWSVKNSYCSLTTSEITFPDGTGLMIAPVRVRLRSTGNLDCVEYTPEVANIFCSVNNAIWFKEVKLIGCDFENINQITSLFTVPGPPNATLKIKVSIGTNSKNELMWLSDGDLVVGAIVPATPDNWVKKTSGMGQELVSIFSEGTQSYYSVFPNPFNGSTLSVELMSNTEEVVEIMLYDVFGRQLVKKDITLDKGPGGIDIEFDHRLPAGTYLLVGQSDKILFTDQLVVY